MINSKTKQQLADRYTVTRPTLNKWVYLLYDHYEFPLPVEFYKKARVLPPCMVAKIELLLDEPILNDDYCKVSDSAEPQAKVAA